MQKSNYGETDFIILLKSLYEKPYLFNGGIINP